MIIEREHKVIKDLIRFCKNNDTGWLDPGMLACMLYNCRAKIGKAHCLGRIPWASIRALEMHLNRTFGKGTLPIKKKYFIAKWITTHFDKISEILNKDQ